MEVQQISTNPVIRQGKRKSPTSIGKRGREYILTLPYDAHRDTPDCHHSPIYFVGNPPSCGLCFYKAGWISEVPGQIHFSKVLAENGNPQTYPGFLTHVQIALGLIPPKPDKNLGEWRLERSPYAREQYTTPPGWRQFPISTSLWKLMGFQPPLGIVLVRAVQGLNEVEIAYELRQSQFNIYIRMAKAIRAAMGFLDGTKRPDRDSTG